MKKKFFLWLWICLVLLAVGGQTEGAALQENSNREIDVCTGSDNRGNLSIKFDSEKQFQVCLKAGLSHWVVTWTYYFENDIPVRKDEKISHNGEVRSIAIGKDSKDYRDAFFLKDVALKEDNGATISSWFRKGVYFVDRCRLEQKSSTKSSEGS